MVIPNGHSSLAQVAFSALHAAGPWAALDYPYFVSFHSRTIRYASAI